MTKKRFLNLIRKRIFILVLLIFQFWLIIYTIAERSAVSQIINSVFTVLSLLVCFYIVSRRGKTAFKLIWVFVIMLFPLFGGLFYLLFRFQKLPKKYITNSQKQKNKSQSIISKTDTAKIASNIYPQHKTLISYLHEYGHFPLCENTDVTYLPLGETFFEALKKELEGAEKYIFLEYFIIGEGKMWNAVLEILKRKASEGVKVRVMYDDMGCFLMLPKDYPAILKKYGIECIAFNPFRPVISSLQNNRDHRKIAVIDGITAFTGGINLADEYINEYPKHGHWKDSAVMLKGDAALSFTVMFLEQWNVNGLLDEDFSSFIPQKTIVSTNKGIFVQPYCDSPLDGENVGEQVYLRIINSAKDYLYITTPYFIVDEAILSALCHAAKSGVDVRIITPHIWDKWAIHLTTRSFYKELTEAGIKVYEYLEGFIHSKTFVSDDNIATVGTVNLDYRSLYHHLECGVCMYGAYATNQVKTDFLRTLEKCRLITLKDCNFSPITKIFQIFLRLVAPLL